MIVNVKHLTLVCYKAFIFLVPGCNEVVTWIVFLDPIATHPEDYETFFGFREHHHGREIKLNYREPQPLNGRRVKIIG